MPLSSSEAPESSCRHRTYSRKQKSLGLSCTNFSSLYDRDGIQVIGLDDAASKLGIERRRIYDIVNVLESVGEEGLRENLSSFDKQQSNNCEKVREIGLMEYLFLRHKMVKMIVTPILTKEAKTIILLPVALSNQPRH